MIWEEMQPLLRYMCSDLCGEDKGVISVADINQNLIRRSKERDQEAFSLLLSRHEGYLFRLCYGYLRNKEDALDVIQEVFIKVFRNIGQFDESKDFLPWLKRIAVNTCLNYKRDQGKRTHLSLDYNGEEAWSFIEGVAAGEDVENTVMTLTVREGIHKCLDLLPPAPRIVLTLRYLEDLSCQEIAVLLEQPVGTVKNSLFRARNLLKIVLQQQGLMEV